MSQIIRSKAAEEKYRLKLSIKTSDDDTTLTVKIVGNLPVRRLRGTSS